MIVLIAYVISEIHNLSKNPCFLSGFLLPIFQC